MNKNIGLFPSNKLLLGPGPCNVSDRVRLAMAQPTIGHMDEEFIAIVENCKTMLREVFRTKNQMTFPLSGTGSSGMEFMFVNFVEKGTRVLIGENGVFGMRMANLAESMQADLRRVKFDWGTPCDIKKMESEADDFKPEIIAVVSGETSTGVYQDFNGFSDLAKKHDALLFADCVTSLAGMPVEIDKWGVDVAYSGTQKCLACPPGLSPVTLNERAAERFRKRKSPVPSFYLNLTELLKYLEKNSDGARAYHHTAPINMIYGLQQSLCEVLEEGLENRWQRHKETSDYFMKEIKNLGFEPLVEEKNRLYPLNSIKFPDNIDEANLRKNLLANHKIEIGNGLGPLAGKVLRVGLMGHNSTKANVDRLLSAIRKCI